MGKWKVMLLREGKRFFLPPTSQQEEQKSREGVIQDEGKMRCNSKRVYHLVSPVLQTKNKKGKLDWRKFEQHHTVDMSLKG